MTQDQTNDYAFQARFVVDNAWRLQAVQDDNLLSPSHGCFHYAYWRDKTSEFADARFQEAGATLALLSLPQFDDARAAGRLAPAETLYQGFAAALKCLSRQQYPDGCYDEWYKGERGFAATEFTTIAYGLAARLLGDRLRPTEQAVLIPVMTRAGHWLARRHDRVKANHEAAAAAALALAWEVTGDDTLKNAARLALNDTLRRQQPEGWFPEVGGMDLGYCSVLLDYVMIYTMITGDQTGLPAMRRLFAFMRPYLHPDGTISPEMGLCLNPYVSRLGMGLLSAFDPDARAMVMTLRTRSPGIRGLTPYLADDLRFCRWSHLPLAALLLSERFGTAEPNAAPIPIGWTIHDQALVAAWHSDTIHVYFSPVGGGVVRVFRGCALIAEDIGVSLIDGGGGWGSVGYDSTRTLSRTDHGLEMESSLRPATFFYPSFMARLVLRLGCTFAWSSYLMRKAIDAYRLHAKTAINQSAAPVAKGKNDYGFTRRVEVTGDTVRITDILASRGAPIRRSALALAHSLGETRADGPSSAQSWRMVKTITGDGGATVEVSPA